MSKAGRCRIGFSGCVMRLRIRGRGSLWEWLMWWRCMARILRLRLGFGLRGLRCVSIGGCLVSFVRGVTGERVVP